MTKINQQLRNYNSLKKYFINLDNRKDRLEDTRKQVGDEFIRIEALNGRESTFGKIDSLFDMRYCNKIYKINQTRAQASATISQFKIYKKVLEDSSIKEDDFVLICEDDNRYVDHFREKINELLEFLKQKRFNDAKIIILKYLILEKQVDYLPVLKFYNDNHIHLDKEDLENIKANYPQYYNRALFMSTKSEIYNVMRVSDFENLTWSFEYQSIPKIDTDKNGNMFSNTQSLLSTYLIRPFSASCFLIRKSLIRKIVKKYNKPWWYADDFKQICDVQDILFASPFLAFDSYTGENSSIVPNNYYDGIYPDEFTYSNFHYNRVTKNRHIKLFKRLKKFKYLIVLQYSNNRFISSIAKILQKLVFIRRI